MLASPRDVAEYVGADVAEARRRPELLAADMWVRRHARVDGTADPAVRCAAALLAAVYIADEAAMMDDSRVPNMVRLMLVPWFH